MKQQPFKLTKFKNSSGTVSWRVSGLIGGNQVCRNFQSRDEAVAEKRLNPLQDVKTVTTHLTADRARESEAAYKLLGDRSLFDAGSFYLGNYRSFLRASHESPAIYRRIGNSAQQL